MIRYLVAIVLFLSACDKTPEAQRQSELAAFGIVPGQPTSLVVAGVRLRFPAGYHFKPSATKVEKGKANSVLMKLRYGSVIGGLAASETPNRHLEGAEATVSLGHPFEDRAIAIRRRRGPAIAPSVVSEQWGLRQLRTGVLDGSSAGEYYESVVERTPRGNAWAFKCQPHSVQLTVYGCTTAFDHPAGLGVSIEILNTQLPEWRSIVGIVTTTIDELVKPSTEAQQGAPSDVARRPGERRG